MTARRQGTHEGHDGGGPHQGAGEVLTRHRFLDLSLQERDAVIPLFGITSHFSFTTVGV
jgi:hypothetical protein